MKQSKIFFLFCCIFIFAFVCNTNASQTSYDSIDYSNIKAAKHEGWKGASNVAMSTSTDSAVGKYSLSIKVIKPKKYSGVHLNKLLDLSGADTKDTISFYVKENY